MIAPDTPDPPPALRMEDVAVASAQPFGHHARQDRASALILCGVNWTVHAGDYWVIAGLQSSGKTDFLLMTAGLTAPAEGSYRLFGELMPIFEDRRVENRLRLGLVFSNGRLFHQLSIWENIALPLRYHRDQDHAAAAEAIEPLVEAMEIGPWAANLAGTVPLQWQKRAGLARALALRPEVLLLDDPLAGLDPQQAAWWLDFLGELATGHTWMGGRRVTLVATCADLRPWKSRAGQFAILKDRRFTVLGGRPQLETTGMDFVRELDPLESGSPAS